MGRFVIANILFGHVHNNKTLMDEYPNCMCVSVERIY